MSSLNPTKEEGICGTEKYAFGQNIVVKEEEVDIAVTTEGNIFRIKKEEDEGIHFMEDDVKNEEQFKVKSEDFKVKEEEETHGIKQEDVTVKEEKMHFRIPKVEEDVLRVKEMKEAEDPTIPNMAARKTRSSGKLRSWMVDQVNSGRYRGLIWDDDSKTMFRIPWKHARKQDYRCDDDGAIFKAWAVFKGSLSDGSEAHSTSWKSRLRVALNKSKEFKEVKRSQQYVSEPYKVYRLIPINKQVDSQTLQTVNRKGNPRARGLKRVSNGSDSQDEEEVGKVNQMEEVSASLSVNMSVQEDDQSALTIQQEQVNQPVVITRSDGRTRPDSGQQEPETSEPDQRFNLSEDLESELRRNTGKKTQHCSQSGKSYQAAYLKLHEITHTGEKPYKCSQCKNCFMTSEELKIHEQKHTGEKPYKCSQCEMFFTRFGNKKQHEMRHTGEKPYKCSQCEKCFFTSRELKSHEQRHRVVKS